MFFKTKKTLGTTDSPYDELFVEQQNNFLLFIHRKRTLEFPHVSCVDATVGSSVTYFPGIGLMWSFSVLTRKSRSVCPGEQAREIPFDCERQNTGKH